MADVPERLAEVPVGRGKGDGPERPEQAGNPVAAVCACRGTRGGGGLHVVKGVALDAEDEVAGMAAGDEGAPACSLSWARGEEPGECGCGLVGAVAGEGVGDDGDGGGGDFGAGGCGESGADG